MHEDHIEDYVQVDDGFFDGYMDDMLFDMVPAIRPLDGDFQKRVHEVLYDYGLDRGVKMHEKPARLVFDPGGWLVVELLNVRI